MKKLLLLLFILILCTSVFADSYTQTVTEVTSGAFPEGVYAVPEQLIVGASSTSTDASLYAVENDKTYAVYGRSSDTSNPAVIGVGFGKGVTGMSMSSSSANSGVNGIATNGASGVFGNDTSGSGIGVKAYSANYGFYSSGADYGIYIPSAETYGGKFISDTYGIHATGDSVGVYGVSSSVGVYGKTSSTTSLECGVKAYNFASGNTGYLGCYNNGIYTPDDAAVGGELTVGSCSGCDVAEHFIGNNLEAGDVVVLDSTAVRGVAKTSTPYNKLAAGIVSTEPTITMGIKEGVPISLSGVVPTKVIGKVAVGDLLTTSSTAGYAMACTEHAKCAGAIIGKAMENNAAGKGKITALVMLG